MDEAVLRSMARWPNVPAVFGWLRLDRRGVWWVKNAVNDEFERITNRAIIEFIGRNYACDEQGRWYFQNGPQRVFVSLEYAPLVIRLADDSASLIGHTDWPIAPRDVWLDDAGTLAMSTDRGAGVLLDRDLAAFVDGLGDADGGPVDAERLMAIAGRGGVVHWQGAVLRLEALSSAAMPRRLGFQRDPQPNRLDVRAE